MRRDDYPDASERLKAATDKLEAGIAELFDSGRYTEYLTTMSKFHQYSFRNVLLILLQCPNATKVAGFWDWKNKFQRSVKRGEAGITILAPTSYRRLEDVDEEGPDGRTVTTRRLVEHRTFRTVTVFDVSQTEGKELPSLTTELTGTVERYAELTGALKKLSPVPVMVEDFPGSAKGYFSAAEGRIVVRPGMSQTQTLKTMVHEVAHAKLHAVPSELDRNSREVEAESVAYVVCQHFGVDTSEYTFGYVAGWSKGREMVELKASLERIRTTAAQIIDGMEDPEKELAHPSHQEAPRRAQRRTAAQVR